MNFLITICARGGSKGIPGKNIKMLCGKPLIAYSIETANQFALKFGNTQIVLSTDSDEIKNVAAKHGLISDYSRPDFLASDTAGKIDAIRHVVEFYEAQNRSKYDYVIDLDVTSPLRNLADLSTAFHTIKDDDKALNIFSVSPANRSPYFNMVEQQPSGYFGLAKTAPGTILTRQSAPKVYDMNASFYIYRRAFFDSGSKGAITDKSLVYVVPHQCFDLDHPIDFDFISYLIENKKLDFDL